jgi:Na+-driven multidrug efflux pump
MTIYGINGIAISTVLSDLFCTIEYLMFLNKKNLLTLKTDNFMRYAKKILNSGFYIQIRNISYKTINILMFNKISLIDFNGSLLASYIILSKIFDLGLVGYFGLGTVGYTLVPSNIKFKKNILKRLFFLTNIYSILQIFYIGSFYFISSFLTKDINVIINIKKFLPLLYTNLFLQGLSNNYDGLIQGEQKFNIQSIISVLCLIFSFVFIKISKNINHLWGVNIGISLIRLISLYSYNKKYLTNK